MSNDALLPVLERIANALERVSPVVSKTADLAEGPAFYWNGVSAKKIGAFVPVALNLLSGIDKQKAKLLENSERHAKGLPSHDILLWGSRGMGKSASVKSVASALMENGHDIALIEASADHLDSLPQLFSLLSDYKRRFIIFIDDIGFDDESSAPRMLRSMLEGGASARPDNARLYVTSNRRHIVARNLNEQNDPINPRDVVDDKLALSDRFGLRLGFHAATQDDYLDMVAGYAARYGLDLDLADALLWATQRGSRSGRVAWQYIMELAGRAGKTLK